MPNLLSAYGDLVRLEGEVSVLEPSFLILLAEKAIGEQVVATRNALLSQGVELDASSLVVHTTEDDEGHIQIGWRMHPLAACHFSKGTAQIERQFPLIDHVLTSMILKRLEDAPSL